MTIDWLNFTPYSALAGGVLIGAAAAILLLMNGRIAGISSIAGELLRPARGEGGWRIAFIAGLVAAPMLWALATKYPEPTITAGYPLLIAAGFLVGLGTRYGSGCTSGHGVCGLSRLSLRSLIATLAFMGTGFATVYLVRHAFA
jgi:uncharacterized protein